MLRVYCGLGWSGRQVSISCSNFSESGLVSFLVHGAYYTAWRRPMPTIVYSPFESVLTVVIPFDQFHEGIQNHTTENVCVHSHISLKTWTPNEQPIVGFVIRWRKKGEYARSNHHAGQPVDGFKPQRLSLILGEHSTHEYIYIYTH